MLFLFGIPSPFTDMFSQAVTNTTYVLPNITANSTGTIAPITSIDYTKSNFFFNLFFVLGATAIVGGILAWVLGTNFGMVYVIPAIIIANLLFFTLSPIGTICNVLTQDPNLSILGWFLFMLFGIVNILGVYEFTRGGEM